MRTHKLILNALSTLILLPTVSSAQYPWSGILPAGTAIDWSQAGVPGGIPDRTTICTNISATGSDQTTAINTALASCSTGGGGVVSLDTGTFLINGSISIPSNVSLRGQGAANTILNAQATSGPDITLGSLNTQPTFSGATNITGGTSQASTSITLSSASGFTIGQFVVIDQQNDNNTVSSQGSEGPCTWCSRSSGTYAQGQISQITAINGSTLTISPGSSLPTPTPLKRPR